MKPSEDILTVPEMGKLLKIGKSAAYELVKRPGFPVYNLGEKKLRVIKSEVLSWLKGQKEDEAS